MPPVTPADRPIAAAAAATAPVPPSEALAPAPETAPTTTPSSGLGSELVSGPKLAPPGAGIPLVERWVGGAIFAIRRLRGTPERFARDFSAERKAIGGLLGSLDDQKRAERVLVPRLRGLEDSSRYWSAWMVLDHLRIVNLEIARVIDSLAQDAVPAGHVSTAAVKPSERAAAEVVAAYEQACDRLAASAAAGGDLRTRLRHAHPWFGALDGAGWHAMAGMHMAIHRTQLERIAATLEDARSVSMR